MSKIGKPVCSERSVAATRRQEFEVSAHGDNFLWANKRVIKLMADFSGYAVGGESCCAIYFEYIK